MSNAQTRTPGHTELWAVFGEEPAARAAAARWPDAEVYTSEPPETMLGRHSPVKTPLGLAALAGGIIGGLAGGALAIYAFTRMSLEVGGFPQVPYAPVGIVIFAIAALEAITAVVVVLIVKGRLATLTLAMPEEARRQVAQGAVATLLRLGPETSAGEREALARDLKAAGAEVTLLEVQ